MIGQEKILNKLKSYTINTLPKNLLFLGPYGGGKHTIAREVAKYYGVDIIELSAANFEDEKLIEYQQDPLDKLYVIDLDTFLLAQQNKFLKFIEEPGLHVFTVLTASSENSVLPTILNRCIKYRLEDYTINQLKQIRNFNDEKIYKICKTPLQLIKANEVQIAQLAGMCRNIIDNISNVDISQVLRISNNINYAEDYNKFDFDLFFSTLQYTAYNDFIVTKNLNSYKIYIFTAQYLQKLLYKNISKESFLLGYLSELKIFLG